MEDYDALFAAQNGACAICGGTRRGNLHVDHDHAQERALRDSGVSDQQAARRSVRGLLCANCNKYLLRAARDRVSILESAIAYLNHPPAPQVLLTDCDK